MTRFVLDCLHEKQNKLTLRQIRVIMARKILYHAQKRKKSIYQKACERYNRKIVKPMVEFGVQCQMWIR